MSDPRAAGPDPGAVPTHRSRPRRRAARPAGPPPTVDAASAADSSSTQTISTAPELPTDGAPPAARTRTKPRHGAKTAGTKDSTPAQPARAPAGTSGGTQTKAQAPPSARRSRPAPARREDGADAAWRDLAGGGPSKVGLSGALRARDVDRPTAEDLAEAERSVVIVRRDAPDQRVGSVPNAPKQAAKQNASATGDAPARRGRRKRPSGSGV